MLTSPKRLGGSWVQCSMSSDVAPMGPAAKVGASVSRSQGQPPLGLMAALVLLVALYVPTFIGLARSVWDTDAQGHGPIVLAVSVWLLYRGWPELSAVHRVDARAGWGWVTIGFGALLYIFGRSQDILLFEVGSLAVNLAGIILLFTGWRGIRIVWFSLFFLLFMVPLPSAVVDTLTQPMKLAVSSVADSVLFALGYPISRSGVILSIGPYQLLVADACAGLNTLFTLEALGLLYLNMVRTASAFRNISLAILIVPISFLANVIRVIVLSLITYYFGDEAGQGFLHGFAGMVLFMSALGLIIVADGVLRLISQPMRKAAV